MQFESHIGPGNDGIFALVEITDFTPSTVPDFYANPEEDDGEPATVEWHFVDEDGNRDDDLHIAATEADYERITQEAIDVAYSLYSRNYNTQRGTPRIGWYARTQ
ncbi:MAG: hypothetical protein ACMV1D_08600 [Macromonas sp.]